MKKKIALLLAAALAVTSLPMSAFASSDNNVSKIPTVEVDKEFTTSITIDEFKGITAPPEKQTVKLTLNNAEFLDKQASGSLGYDKSAVDEAQAELEQAQEDKAAADTAVENAQSSYNSAKSAYDAAVESAGPAKTAYDNALAAKEQAEANVESAEYALFCAEEEKELAYFEFLDAQDAYNAIKDSAEVSDKEKATAAAAVTEAQEKVKKCNETAENADIDLDNAQNALNSAENALKDAEEEYAPYKSQIQNAESALDSTETTLNNALSQQADAATAVTNAKEKLDAAQNNVLSSVKYTLLSDTQCMAEFYATSSSKTILTLYCKATDEGDATVTVENIDSVVSSETLKIANVASGSTTTSISDTTSISESGVEIKSIVIDETTAGTLEAGTLKLRLSNGFKFKSSETPSVVVFPSKGNNDLEIVFYKYDNDYQDALFTVTGSSTTASTVSIGNLWVYYDDDDAEEGDDCSITVSGAGTNKESVEIGTAADYGISFTTKDDDLPVFYSGTYDDDTDTVKIKFKENIEGSWLENRKTKIEFPEGVEPISVDIKTKKNCRADDSNFDFDENEVEISGISRTGSSGKIELEFTFTLSVSPEFTGDITAVLTGSAVGDDKEITVGEAVFPVEIDADVNELAIDYRNTAASDIVITEADAGVLKKGTTVYLAIDGISFDGDPTVEVEDGDMKIENIKVKGENIQFDIKTESQKEAAVIRISDIELYMERSLPSGEYDLMIVAEDKASNKNDKFSLSDDAIIRNYGDDDEQGIFDIDEITVLDGYVTVVTAGRDQDDSTFTTKISVTVGADVIMAGTKEIALDVPAYISNGYTMLPVRAVTEALSESAIVRWDDATKTVIITFGQRVISMTVGSKTMIINGVNVAMQAACEITDSRSFIPLRDLGYALGLNDNKINWDDATKTATLN